MTTNAAISSPTDLLTQRQLEVLELLAKGLTNREIAGVLQISLGTAKNHVAAVLAALEVTNRTEAAVVLADWAAAAPASGWEPMGGADPDADALAARVDGATGLEVPGFGERPAIAVLPFDDWSEDPQAFFVDGLAEDLITRLASWRWFPVIARNSSFRYRGRSVDVREVSRALGARYVVEGSVRVIGRRGRVTAQLLDGASGEHVWADRWDVVLDEVFLAQDEIVDRIVASLEPALSRVERLRVLTRPVETLSAWEAVQSGLHHLWRQAAGDLERAVELFERARELDPAFAPGHWGASIAHLTSALYGVGGRALEFDEVLTRGLRAVEIDPLDFMARLAAAGGLTFTGSAAAGMEQLEHSVALNPSSSLACAARAWRELDPGHADSSAHLLERAHRLSPFDPLRSHFLGPLAVVRMVQGRFEEALELARRCIRAESETSFTYQPLVASCLAHLGRESEAREEGRRLLARLPGADHRLTRLLLPPETFEILREGLLRAGVDLPG